MRRKVETFIIVSAIAALVILIPFASSNPDGLEKVAESLNVQEHEPLWKGIMPDYTLENIENPYFSTLISGIIGFCLVLITSLIITEAISKKNS